MSSSCFPVSRFSSFISFLSLLFLSHTYVPIFTSLSCLIFPYLRHLLHVSVHLSSLPSSLSFLIASFFTLHYLHLPTMSNTSLSSFLTSCLPAYYLFISKSLPFSSLPFSHLQPYFRFPTMPYKYTSLHSPSPSSSLPAFTFSSLITFPSSFLPFAPPYLHLPIISYTSLHSSSTAPSLPPSPIPAPPSLRPSPCPSLLPLSPSLALHQGVICGQECYGCVACSSVSP